MIVRHGVFRTWRSRRLNPRKAILQRRLLNETTGNGVKKDELPLSEKIRSMMREMPHPLTVIVAQGKKSSRKSKQPAGLLVSSFNTVTLHPAPYISFNIKLPSSTFEEIKKSRTFGASAVGDLRLAKDFLLPKQDEEGKDNLLYTTALQRNVLDGRIGLLKHGRGAIWWMKCCWVKGKSVVVGDHIIVVAAVIQSRYYENVEGQSRGSEKPLIYSEGEYRNAGPPIG
ncbi:MAG: hypothetical protein Q9224_003224 [Gallowayella concinna]